MVVAMVRLKVVSLATSNVVTTDSPKESKMVVGMAAVKVT